jgi:hypothetical protein
MAKNDKRTIRDTLMLLTCYTEYDHSGEVEVVKKHYGELPDDVDPDDCEFSYGELLDEKLGIESLGDGYLRIDLRRLYAALQSEEFQSILNIGNYTDIYLQSEDQEGSVQSAEIYGVREETDEDIAKRLEVKRKEEETKRLAKEAKKQATEQRKIEKLKKDVEKYKGLI